METNEHVMMTDENRRIASIEQTIYYLSTYFCDWRLTKILSLEKMLNERYVFFKDIKKVVKQHDDDNGDVTISQEIKNGIYFDAIATCVQYIEDLFALIRASDEPDFFIREISTYAPGDVSKYIQKFEPSRASIGKAFHFPVEYENPESKNIEKIEKSIQLMCDMIKDCIDFYNNHKFKYNKYKHGLSIALRPFGKRHTDESVELDKIEMQKPHLQAYDSYKLDVARKRGGFSGSMAMIPCLTDNIMPFIGSLEKENNLLRGVLNESNLFLDLTFEHFVDIANKVSVCLKVFRFNYSQEIDYRLTLREFYLPVSTKTDYGEHIVGRYSSESKS